MGGLVAGAVEWLTGINPVTLIEERKAEDPRRGDERQVIAALHECSARPTWTAKEAMVGCRYGHAGDGHGPRYLGCRASRSRAIDPPPTRSVIWLRKRKDKVLGDIQLVGSLDRNGIARWQVRGMRGIAGYRLNQPREIGKNGLRFRGAVAVMVRRTNRRAGDDIPRNPPHPPQAEEFEL